VGFPNPIPENFSAKNIVKIQFFVLRVDGNAHPEEAEKSLFRGLPALGKWGGAEARGLAWQHDLRGMQEGLFN
jgi:hypothetical protein